MIATQRLREVEQREAKAERGVAMNSKGIA